MIRQIWKVRNTDGDPAGKPPLATEETSAAQATQNDESQREEGQNPKERKEQSAEQVEVASKPSDQA